MKKVTLISRVLAFLLLAFALPFYFGYGNPLPFTDPNNSLLDNLWLMVFPVVFIALVLGWRYPRVAAYMILFSVLSVSMFSLLVFGEGFPWPMSGPVFVALLYLVSSFRK